MVNRKCFSRVDLLVHLHCMVVTISHQQVNLDGCVVCSVQLMTQIMELRPRWLSIVQFCRLHQGPHVVQMLI